MKITHWEMDKKERKRRRFLARHIMRTFRTSTNPVEKDLLQKKWDEVVEGVDSNLLQEWLENIQD